MKKVIKQTIFWLAKHSGLFGLSRGLTRRGLRILCYHGIWIGPGHYGTFTFMSPAKFAARMRWLARSRYPVMPLDQAIDALRSGALPNCATVITIDDGWYGTYKHMVPTLTSERLPATLYATTYYAEKQRPVFNLAVRYIFDHTTAQMLDLGALDVGRADRLSLRDVEQREVALSLLLEHGNHALDNEQRHHLCRRLAEQLGIDYDMLAEQRVLNLMSLDELRSTAQTGIDIQLHTHRHRFPVDDTGVIAQEIEDNRRRLEPIVGKRLHHFCYPSGEFDPSVWPCLQRLGIESATTTDVGLNFRGSNLLALARILDGENITQIEFEAEMAGFLELLRRARRFVALRAAAWGPTRR